MAAYRTELLYQGSVFDLYEDLDSCLIFEYNGDNGEESLNRSTGSDVDRYIFVHVRHEQSDYVVVQFQWIVPQSEQRLIKVRFRIR